LSGGGSNGGRSIEPPAVSTRLGSGHGKSFGIRPHIAPIRSSGRGQEKLKHLAARRLDALKRWRRQQWLQVELPSFLTRSGDSIGLRLCAASTRAAR
jgi:hypothetical protein